MFRFFKVSCILFTSTFVFLFLLSTFSTAENHGDIILVTPLNNYDGNGEIPESWEVKEFNGRADIKVVKEDIGHVFHLISSSTSTALYKQIKLDLKEFPYLNWQWKVSSIPHGADVRRKDKDDQAAQVYVIFPPKWPWPTTRITIKLLGYIWDSSTPVGSDEISRKWSKTRYVVIKSGLEGIGKWFKEKRNVYEDYKRLFGEEPPLVIKLAIMIDSDDTKGTAESFIGDIYFSKN